MTFNKMIAALGAAILITMATGPARAADHQPVRTLSLTGTGESSSPPDTATVSAGVVTEAPDAKSAVQRNSETVGSLFRSLKDMGIADRDMQTRSFNISPVYTRPPRGEQAQISGYRVSNSVTVRVRDLSELGTVLDRLVKAGANQMNGVSFYIDRPADLMDEARRRAVADVRRKADVYAEAAGIRIKGILSISEGGGRPPQPMLRTMAAESAENVPVAAGEQTISASVTITYEIE